MKERGRLGDAKSVEQLKQHEEKENLKNNTNQQLDETSKLGLLSNHYEKIESDHLLKNIKKIFNKFIIKNLFKN